VCWVLEEPREYFLSPFKGRFEPYLELRNQNLHGRLVRAKPGQLLSIRYASVVPGFLNAYRKFLDLDELETEIKAHLYLYSLMAPVLEEVT
jgi:hypothetical protein